MYASVPLKPLFLGNCSLLFLQNLTQWYLVRIKEKNKLMGTELRRAFYFAQRCAQWAKNSGAFWKKNSFVFSEKKSKMKHCHLYFTKNPLPVKSLVLKLCVKMLLANQIEGFFKVQYLKKKLWDQENFLYVNKNQSFLQGNTVFLAWVVRHA